MCELLFSSCFRVLSDGCSSRVVLHSCLFSQRLLCQCATSFVQNILNHIWHNHLEHKYLHTSLCGLFHGCVTVHCNSHPVGASPIKIKHVFAEFFYDSIQTICHRIFYFFTKHFRFLAFIMLGNVLFPDLHV